MMEHIKSIYFKDNKSYLRALVLREHEYYIYKFQKYLRGEEAAKTIFFKVYYRIKTNILGRKLGFTIPPDVFAEGLHIWHYGNIVVNRGARVGKNCVLHGDNCIGMCTIYLFITYLTDNTELYKVTQYFYILVVVFMAFDSIKNEKITVDELQSRYVRNKNKRKIKFRR